MMRTVTEKEQLDALWIAVITALRSVGHVLDKVDCTTSSKLMPNAFRGISR